jgi:hypothetical protein
MDMSVKLNHSQPFNALQGAISPDSSPQSADVSSIKKVVQPKRAELDKR